jgi:hypothetical protein
MDESDKNQKTRIRIRPDSTFPVGQAANVVSAYRNLFAVLNKLGYYPEYPEDAKRMAEELLARGRKEE